ncbi:Uncharacterised protein [Streptococcus pneumoniae]|nr:Uncharacterised protein [Streptococcus pneumoniae]
MVCFFSSYTLENLFKSRQLRLENLFKPRQLRLTVGMYGY